MDGSYRCLLSTTRSDSHMWNLIFLQAFLEERGFQVVNLGICTPVSHVIAALKNEAFDILVISTLNGHGMAEGTDLVHEIRRRHPTLPCVIGGMLTTRPSDEPAASAHLLAAGYDRVYSRGDDASAFGAYIDALRKGHAAIEAQP